jgi:DNA-binding NtrC family response regulator
MAAQGARILVIDDDELLGNMVRRALAPEHEAMALTSAREALARIASGERWDLILCDLMLPQVSGIDFYERMGELAPELLGRIVFIPGGAVKPRAAAFLARPSIARLEKPFSLAELRRFVHERLSG